MDRKKKEKNIAGQREKYGQTEGKFLHLHTEINKAGRKKEYNMDTQKDKKEDKITRRSVR